MEREEFERLVEKAVGSLPEEFRMRLQNIDIVTQDRPTRHQLRSASVRRGDSLFGLYEGVPITKRTTGYGLVPPDKITIFQKVLEEYYHDDSQIALAIQRVVRHEIAHHFGISDERLREIEDRGH